MRQPKLSTFILLLLLVAMLSGCLGGRDPGGPAPLLHIPANACPNTDVGTCHVDEEGNLVLSNLLLEGTPQDFVGLYAQGLSRSLIVQDFIITGPQIGIQIDGSCTDCSVTLRRGVISVEDLGVRLGDFESSIGGAVVMEEVTVATTAAGTSTEDPIADLPPGWTGTTQNVTGASTGLSIQNVTGEVRLADVGIKTPFSLGSGLFMDHLAGLTLENVDIQGYRSGIKGFVGAPAHGNLGHLAASHLSITCGRGDGGNLVSNGIDLARRAATAIVIEKMMIQDCSGNGMHFSYPRSSDVERPVYGDLIIRNMTARNNHIAFTAYEYADVVISDFLVEGGTVGMRFSATPLDAEGASVILQDGTMRDISGVAVAGVVGALDVHCVSFYNNGHGGPVDSSELIAGSKQGGIMIGTPIQWHDSVGPLVPPGVPGGGPFRIRDSEFSGNAGAAVAISSPITLGVLATIDAASNWWGSPAGPSPSGPDVPPELHVLGDPVWPMVMTTPHLTDPSQRVCA